MIKYVTFFIYVLGSSSSSSDPRCSFNNNPPGFWKLRIFNGRRRHCYSCLNLNYNGEFYVWKCSESHVMVLRRWLRLPSTRVLHAADARPFPVRWNHYSWCSDYLDSYRLLSRFADNTFDSLPLCNILVSGSWTQPSHRYDGKLNCFVKNSLAHC